MESSLTLHQEENNNSTHHKTKSSLTSKTLKTKITTIISEAKTLSNNPKTLNEAEYLANICLMSPEIDLSNKINALTLLSYVYHTSQNKTGLYYWARKIEKYSKTKKGIDDFIYIRTFYRAAMFLIKYNKNIFHSFYYLNTCVSSIKNSKIDQLSYKLLIKLFEETRVSINDYIRDTKELFSNFEKIESSHLTEIVTILNKYLFRDNEGESTLPLEGTRKFIVNAKWMKQAKAFLDYYLKYRKKMMNLKPRGKVLDNDLDKEFLNFIRISFDATHVTNTYWGWKLCLKENSNGEIPVFPGKINNYYMTKQKNNWDDVDEFSCDNYYVNKGLEVWKDYYLMERREYNILKSLFGSTDDIERKDEEKWMRYKVYICDKRFENEMFHNLYNLKNMQIEKGKSVMQFKEKILRCVERELKNKNKHYDVEGEIEKVSEKNDEDKASVKQDQVSEWSGSKGWHLNTKDKNGTNCGSAVKEKLSHKGEEWRNRLDGNINRDAKENCDDIRNEKSENISLSIVNSETITFPNIKLFEISKSDLGLLFELTIALRNNIPPFQFPCKEIATSDTSQVSSLPSSPSKIIIAQILSCPQQPWFFTPFTNNCRTCTKVIPKPRQAYCEICHLNQYCSSTCLNNSLEHSQFHKYLLPFKIEIFSFKSLISKPISEVINQSCLHGLVGLRNFGNTCYMNSAIQCWSNTEDWTKYFLLSKYEQEINYASKLGSSGSLVKTYYDLISNLWCSRQRSFSPWKFVRWLAEKFKQFAQFDVNSQQDSHEMWSLLLDNLHEDLNRISNKPYIELLEQGKDEVDEEASKRWWDSHWSREDSIIVDLFHGQFKSTIVCPDCERTSITYDPFMFLSLSIPFEQKKIIWKFFPLQPNICIQYEVPIYEKTTLSNLKDKIISNLNLQNSELIYKNKEQLLILAVLLDENKMVKTVLPNEELIYPHFDKGNEICFYQTEHHRDFVPVFIYPFQNEKVNGFFGTKEKNIFWSYPIVICFSINNDTLLTLYKKWHERLKHLLPVNVSPDLHQIFGLSIYHNQITTGLIFHTKENCEFCNSNILTHCALIPRFSFATKIVEIKKLMTNSRPIILLCGTKYFNLVKRVFSNMELNLTNYITRTTLIHSINKWTIYDTLDLFQFEERWGKENTWYCNKCKLQQQALKKINIYRAPNYLIIQFKRFKIKSNGRIEGYFGNKKNTILIEYPVFNWDLSSYVVGPNKGEAIYNWYGIVEHVGSVDRGHYVAVCRNFGKWFEYNDEFWSEVNNEKLVSNRAYILFYKNKHIEGS